LPRIRAGGADACRVGGWGCQRGEEAEPVCGIAVRVGVVEHEDEACDGQLLAVQTQCSNSRVVDVGRAAFEVADVVACPELSESCAGERQFADELDGPSVGDVVTDGTAERCDRGGYGVVPVIVELALLRIEEEVTEPVMAPCEARRERGGKGVRGEDVEVSSLDECGNVEGSEEMVHPCRNSFSAPWLPVSRSRGSEAEKVLGLDIVESQNPGQGFQDLRRRIVVTAAFESEIVVSADPGEQGNFFTAKTSHATVRGGRDACLFGRHQAAAGA
jgi:hypothetical protein